MNCPIRLDLCLRGPDQPGIDRAVVGSDDA
jgi:hypothetical protein